MSKNDITKREPIAIVGIGCRFPGDVNNSDDFWNLLKNKVDAIGDIPESRWNLDAYYHPDKNKPGKMYVKQGGFIKNFEDFDAQFFGISPVEALRMDPQQRIMLEVAYEAFEDGGIKLEDIYGTNVGVFIGTSSQEFGMITARNSEWTNINANHNPGMAMSIFANRISYLFNLKGPSIVFDTACSSSLTALNFAIKSIRSGESKMAVVGGINIIISPSGTIGFSKGTYLSPDARCKAFDARANGYVRSEGAGAVVLKPLSEALRDGDNIYSLIIGTAINQDGKTPGMAVPDMNAQSEMLKEAYADAGIEPEKVCYVEAHGTGTPVGDPIEAKAIGKVVGKNKKDGKCYIGTVKTNIGHLEPASGIAGLIKTSLILKNRTIVPNLHFEEPNPQIPFDELSLKVATEEISLKDRSDTLYASVNSFGFGGSNAHVVLQEPPQYLIQTDISFDKDDNKKIVYALSARSSNALKKLAKEHIVFLKRNENINDTCNTLLKRRSSFEKKLVLYADTKKECMEKLEAFVADSEVPGMHLCKNADKTYKNAVFVFSGQGSQWWGMGRQLLSQNKLYFETISEIDNKLKAIGWLKEENSDLMKELMKEEATSRMSETQIAQPAIFAVQVALARMWMANGVTPTTVVGHSIGEVAAAYISGALSLEDAVKVVYCRSKSQVEAEGKGKMLAVGVGFDEANQLIKSFEGKIDLAVINGPSSVTLAGDEISLQKLSVELKKSNIYNSFIRVNIPFHSYMMDSIKDKFLDALGEVNSHKTRIPLYSTVTGKLISGEELNKNYWYDNIRQPVLFYQAIEEMLKYDFGVFVEVSPHPILSVSISETCEKNNKKGIVVDSIRRNEPEIENFYSNLCKLISQGYVVNADILVPGEFNKIPAYPWQKETYWLESEEGKIARKGRIQHPHIKSCRKSIKEKGTMIWDVTLNHHVDNYIKDHRVQGPIVYPGAGQMDIILTIANKAFGKQDVVIQNVNLLAPIFVPEENRDAKVQVEIHSDEGRFYIYSNTGVNGEEIWTRNTFGRINCLDDNFEESRFEFDQLIENLKRVDLAEFDYYSEWIKSGLQFGPTFKVLNFSSYYSSEGNRNKGMIEINCHEDVLFDLDIHSIHPTLLDGCFQAGVLSSYKKHSGNICIPVGIDSLQLIKKPITSKLWSYFEMKESAIENPTLDFIIFDQNKELVMKIKGFRFKFLDNSAKNSDSTIDKYLYTSKWSNSWIKENGWERDSSFINANSFLERLRSLEQDLQSSEISNNYYTNMEPEFDEIGKYNIINTLIELGIDCSLGASGDIKNIAERIGISPKFIRLFNYMFNSLKDGGLILLSGNEYKVLKELKYVDIYKKLEKLKEKYIDFKNEIAIFEKSCSILSKVLTGENSAVSVLFDASEDANMDKFYASGYTFKELNEITVYTMKNIVEKLPKDQEIRILEVGAGTGGMTRGLLEVLPLDRTKYVFTDISAAFLNNARETFSSYDFMEFKMLNLEEEINTKEFDLASFDMVIASDVIHATTCLTDTIKRVRSLLAKNGVLLMLEITNQSIFVNLIFGLFEGWWNYKDTEFRKNKTMLSCDSWKKFLPEMGFTDILSFSHMNPVYYKDGAFEQTVFLARNKESISQKSECEDTNRGQVLIFTDNKGYGNSLTIQLETKGFEVLLIKKGENLVSSTKGDYFVEIDETLDLSSIVEKICKENNKIDKIAYLWHLDDESNMEITSDKIINSQDDNISVLELVKGIGNLSGELPSLYIVTRGVNNIACVEPGNVIHSSAWAMGRVIINECTNIKTKMIDLESVITSEQINALAGEMDAENREQEIAFRNNKRYVNTFERLADIVDQSKIGSLVKASGYPYKAEIVEVGILDSLVLREFEKSDLGIDEVEIAVKATALNFKDIVIAMGLLTDEAVKGSMGIGCLGLECSGVVSRVGENVINVSVGDEVIALTESTIAGIAKANKDMVLHKPKQMSFEEAASFPVVYQTAYYSLVNLCSIMPGEKVLIHSATGGVGIAAINIARHFGAEIYATAGSDDKREYLRSIGVKNIYDSRTLDFREQIFKDTNGYGVDIVLSSLTGKAMVQSFRCLAPYGRFVEIGKTDIYDNKQIGLELFGDNISYFVVDLSRIAVSRPQLGRRILNEALKLYMENSFEKHPLKVYPISQIQDAFLFMSKGKHIGKVILSMQEELVNVLTKKKYAFKEDATYVIAGGVGGFGLETAKWMCSNRAQNIVLLGRSGTVSEESQEIIEGLINEGKNIKILKCDICCEEEINNVFENIKSDFPEIKGIIHSAMVLEDAPVSGMTKEKYMKAFLPKAIGAWNLHRVSTSLNLDLDLFVMYSSIASAIGNPGQCNYSAGNGFLDGFVSYRRRLGLPATTINWGSIGEAGFVARQKEIGKYFDTKGINPFMIDQCFATLDKVLRLDIEQVVASNFDWKELNIFFNNHIPVRLERMFKINNSGNYNKTSVKGDILSILASLNANERIGVLSKELGGYISKLLAMKEGQIEVDVSISRLGLDSLMANQFKNYIQVNIGVNYPIMKIMQGPTINELAKQLLSEITFERDDTIDTENLRISLKKNEWFICSKPAEDPAMRLFCFPHIGGTASVFGSWNEMLNKNIEVRALQLPGREERSNEDFILNMDKLLEVLEINILPLLDRPFAFYGHSLGCYISLLLADKLANKYNKKPDHIYLGSLPSGRIFETFSDYSIEKVEDIPQKEFEIFIKDLDFDEEIFNNVENQTLISMIKADLLLGLYLLRLDSLKNNYYIPCDTTIIRGEDDPIEGVTIHELMGRLNLNQVSQESIKGGHLFITKLDSIRELMSHLNRDLGE